MPTATAASAATRRVARRKTGSSLSAEVLDVLGELATAFPTVAEVEAELNVPLADLVRILDALEHGGKVERWTCANRPGSVRVMLSAVVATRRGLRLDERGDRWLAPA